MCTSRAPRPRPIGGLDRLVDASMTDARPKVSIGIPVYNGGPFFAECLESVARQTFGDFEVIISDNASTDETADVARSFVERDGRFTYVRSETNRGAAANWNRVVELAHGTYFKWLAADDLVEPTYIERCVAVLDEEPDVVLVTPRVRLIDATGKPLQRTPGTDRYVAPHGETKGAPRAPVTGLASRSALRRFRSVVMYVTDSGLAAYDMSLIRLEPLRSTMLVEPYVGSEKILLAQLSLMGRFVLVPEVLYSWRIHADHMGSKSPAEATRGLDPTWTGRFPMMGPRQIVGYLRAIRIAQVDLITKLGCLAVIIEKIPRGFWSQFGRPIVGR
jgi:glycosyltransferase involved in cell wall biosynthesis